MDCQWDDHGKRWRKTREILRHGLWGHGTTTCSFWWAAVCSNFCDPCNLKTLNNWQLTAYVNIAFLMMCSWTITCRIISLWQVKTKNFEPWHQYQCRGWIWTNQLPPPATVPCPWQGFIPTLQVSWGFIFAETKSSGKTCTKGLWGSRGLWSNARPIHYDKISQKSTLHHSSLIFSFAIFSTFFIFHLSYHELFA